MDESAEPPRRPDPEVPGAGGPDRLDGLEQQVRQLTTRLAGWVEAQLVQAVEDRRADMAALRSELQAVMTERLEAASAAPAVAPERLVEVDHGVEERVAQRLAELHDQVEARLSAWSDRQRADLEALRAELESVAGDAPKPGDGLEQRVRGAMSRLSESVESKLAEATATRQGDLEKVRAEATQGLARQAGELRTEIANTATALRARFTQAQERVDALERQHGEAGERLDALVGAKLAEVVDRRRTEFDQVRWELQEELAARVKEARGEIGTTVSEAHKRFLLSVERLDERVAEVTGESRSVAAQVEAVHEAVRSDGLRIEALEEHTRRTDERLADLVEGKLAELAAERIAELEEFRGQLRRALDGHLAATRAEVASTTGAARAELRKGREEVAEARRELAEAAAQLAAGRADLESLGVAMQDRLREADARLALAVEARLAELDPVARQVAGYRADVAGLAERVEALATATAKAAFAEAGMLAPLRSDLRVLQEQVAELVDSVAALRPRRKAPAVPAGSPVLPAVRPAAATTAGTRRRRPQ